LCKTIENMGNKIRQIIQEGSLREKRENIRQFAIKNFDISSEILRFEKFLHN